MAAVEGAEETVAVVMLVAGAVMVAIARAAETVAVMGAPGR